MNNATCLYRFIGFTLGLGVINTIGIVLCVQHDGLSCLAAYAAFYFANAAHLHSVVFTTRAFP